MLELLNQLDGFEETNKIKVRVRTANRLLALHDLRGERGRRSWCIARSVHWLRRPLPSWRQRTCRSETATLSICLCCKDVSSSAAECV